MLIIMLAVSAVRPSLDSITDADAVFSAQSWLPAFRKDQEEKNSRSKNRGKQFADASEVDLTMDYKPDIGKISLTTQRPKIEHISLTTTETPAYMSHQVDSLYSSPYQVCAFLMHLRLLINECDSLAFRALTLYLIPELHDTYGTPTSVAKQRTPYIRAGFA